MNFRLEEKKERVFKLLVEEYIRSAHPIGSKYLAKKYRLGLSPATIRNYFAYLEKYGLIIQPHTSAGRIPTDLGFRYYVNYLIQPQSYVKKWQKKLWEIIRENSFSLEDLIEQAPKILSQLSHQIGILLRPGLGEQVLKDLYFLRLDSERILAIFIFEDGGIEHKIVKNCYKLNASDLYRLNNYLSQIIRGKTLVSLRTYLLEQIQDRSRSVNYEMVKIWKLSEELLPSDYADLQVSGESYLTNKPEFAQVKHLEEVLQLLEDQRLLIQLLDEAMKNPGVRVMIGKEHPYPQLYNLSIITANYFNKEGKALGSIGILGPKRMDYENLISLVSFFSQTINEYIWRH